MYAIVEIAGHQYKVHKDQQLFVNRLHADEGAKVQFDQVLLIDNDGAVTVGAPAISGAAITAKVSRHLKGDKIIVFKKKRRKGYRKKNGFRASLTEISIESIIASGAKPAKKAEKPAKEEATATRGADDKAAAKAKADADKAAAKAKADADKAAAKAKADADKAAAKEDEAKGEISGLVSEAPTEEKPAKKAAPKKSTSKGDDLRKIEGIGPKIAEHLGNGGISTFAELADASQDRLKEILEAAGPRYKMHNPSTWPSQAKLAAEGKWDELKKWQEDNDAQKG